MYKEGKGEMNKPAGELGETEGFVGNGILVLALEFTNLCFNLYCDLILLPTA